MGDAVYGHYLGYVDPDGYWKNYAGHPFLQHGWVKLPDRRILDPTRWSFENEDPYLALFDSTTGEFGEYDEGGNEWREAMRHPCPETDSRDQLFQLELSPECFELIDHMLPGEISPKALTLSQIHWLANAPYDSFGPYVFAVYQAIARHDRAFIPFDNVLRVRREFGNL